MRVVPTKRPHNRMQESTQVKYTPLSGGLDTVHSALGIEDGRMLMCINFEQVFGKQGYRRIDGYERYDGRLQPHQCEYRAQAFDAGSTEIAVGNVVTGAAVTAQAVSVSVTSGAWATSDAAGVLVLTAVTGSFVDNENILVSGSPVAVADGTGVLGTIADPLYKTRINAARDYLRAKITQVPGSGPIRGVFVYDGVVYALRNASDGLTCVLHQSSLTGWQQIKTGLIPGGAWRMDVGNFTGDTAQLSAYLTDGRNRPAKLHESTWTKMAPIWGSQATSTTSFAIGTGSKVFTVVEASASYTAGDDLIAHDNANAANWMRGLVTAWNSGTKALTIDVTTTGGSGTIADWEIGRADYSDKPFDVHKHKDHLFLAYQRGQLQSSNLGDPMVYTSTAALFGMGDELTGMVSLKGDVMVIYCRNSTHILSGHDLTSWNMEVHSQDAGGIFGTAQKVGDNVFVLDDRGVTSFQATQAYGDFEVSVMSRDVHDIVNNLRDKFVGATAAKNKYQYWLYFDDGNVLTCTVLSPSAVIQPKDVSWSLSRYPHLPSCISSGELANGAEVHLMGTTDGWVMREDVGASFDGEVIPAVLRLPFAHFKSPSNKKRFRKLVIELTAPENATINFKQAFDYADGNYMPSGTLSAGAIGIGGVWDESTWDTFQWSTPIQSQAEANISGVGRNMSLLIWNNNEIVEPFVLEGILIHYSVLGLAR